MAPKVSVIVTVKNEEKTIEKLLISLQAQTRPPDEIVIVDGGSTDRTVEIIKAWAGKLPIKLIVRPGLNISQGRNLAIREASGEIIASTDAGVKLSTKWLEALLRPFEAGAKVVSGFFLPDVEGPFEIAMGATVLPSLEDVNPRKFLPSSRSVAFLKEAWEMVGGYPEWLDYCEDLIFDFKLRRLFGPFPFVPEAIAYFKPRTNLRDFFLQYYRYARGDGKADLWRLRHLIRYSTYLVLVPFLLFLGLKIDPLWWLGFVVGGWVYLRNPYRRLFRMMKNLSLPEKILAFLLVPVIRVTGDVAKMAGYPAGLLWRLKHRPPLDWRKR
ncbi:MAG: glycosyltransferase [Anaerolineae bacterium]|nr:glycosyltransferase [Anaerolineae bacterium]MDW8102915.1 glycosyltransferase [Anaerolineae bacterium]